MSRIINKSQNAFIKGRNIMDGVLSLHEILHETKIKKRDGVILKLDFEKAYDKISWSFFFESMKQRGICETWCEWIKKVVNSGTLSVKVNDAMGSYFKSKKRGEARGPSVSPAFQLGCGLSGKDGTYSSGKQSNQGAHISHHPKGGGYTSLR
jgi:hypothetical protein